MFHIFLVDDNTADSALLLLAFKRAKPDASVYTVWDSRLLPAYLDIKSPVQALRGGGHPDILVLPMATSFHTGLENLAWIRGQTRFDKMFVVMLGTRDDPAEREQAKRAGADSFHVRFPGNNGRVKIAEDIMKEYTLRQAEANEATFALTPKFAIAV